MTTSHVHRTAILAILLTLVATLLATPAHAHNGTSGSQSVTAADRTSLELVAEAYMLAAHNDQRAAGNTRNGVRYDDVSKASPLTGWTDVTTVARRWSDKLSFSYFKHNPDYSKQFGHWSSAGENIAIRGIHPVSHGTPSTTQVRQAAEGLMQSWWKSEGHRLNWMNGSWDHLGVGAALTTMDVGHSEDYWVLAGAVNFRTWSGTRISGSSFPADGRTPPNESSHATSGPSAARFVDVPAGHTFHANIESLATSGVTKGCGADTYCPDDYVTRGQMAAFLTRAMDLPAAQVTFTDTRGHTFEKPAAALARAGITKGCGVDRYCPDDYVTRGQMAAFLVRALDLPAGSSTFRDTRGHLFEGSAAALARSGITKGCSADSFCPDDYVTRGQMAAFLDRAGVLD